MLCIYFDHGGKKLWFWSEILVLPDNLPDETSPGDWLGLRSQADLNSPIYDSSLCSLKWFLKMFSDDEQAMSLSSLFHVLMTLSLKKCWRRSVLTRFLFSFNGCPLVLSCVVYSKNVLKFTVDNPCIILKTSMRSALIRRSSRDHSPSFFNLTSYGNSLRERCCNNLFKFK